MSQNPGANLQRIARQHLESMQLMGVEFVPINIAIQGAETQSAETRSIDHRASSETSAAVARNSGSETADARRERCQQALKELRARHDAQCPHCTSVKYHTQTVFGEGNPCAQLMFIGEAPGEEEDRTGRPFVGRAGQKLEEIIKAMKLSRDDVYIANVLKSRPPENRTPLQNEIEGCAPFLKEQIRIIQPKVIVALGGPASKMMLGTETGITRLRGQWGWYVVDELRIPVMPTFHPAYILRNYTVETRQKVWSDMQAVLQRLAETRR